MLCGTNVFFTFVELLFCFFLFSYFLILSLRFFFFFLLATHTNKQKADLLDLVTQSRQRKQGRAPDFISFACTLETLKSVLSHHRRGKKKRAL